MGWPSPPYPFGSATSPEAMSALDQMFDQAAAMMEIPCSASGTNAISLNPLPNCPALTAYKELGGYRFRAQSTSTGAVTAQYNGLGFLPVYHDDGATQVNVSDVVIGKEYVIRFSQALNAGGGGFFLEAPALSTTTSPWTQPGGRLTLASGVPVMLSNQLAKQVIFYGPYVNQFVPIYNGAGVQMYNFCSSLSDTAGLQLNLGGAANFPSGNNYDVFVSLLGGTTPVLCAIPWTNNTTRATALAQFAGFQTNGGTVTAQTGPNTSATLNVNQGTFLGTFQTSAQGQTQWQFGGSASGGTAAFFNLCNYYNPLLFQTQVTDNGSSYTYTSATVRQARASSGNQINFVQASAERAMFFAYVPQTATVAGAASAATFWGIGINTITAFTSTLDRLESATVADTLVIFMPSNLTAGVVGYGFAAALEASDGLNANTFNTTSLSVLMGMLWL
jgi:hypothetical protein